MSTQQQPTPPEADAQQEEGDGKKKKRERKAPELHAVEPDEMHRGHRTWVRVQGKHLRKNTWRSLEITNAAVLDQRFIDKQTIELLLFIDVGLHDAVIRISLRGAENQMATLKAISLPEQQVVLLPDESGEESPKTAIQLYEVRNEEYLAFLNYLAETGDHSACHPDEPADKSHIPDGWTDKSQNIQGNPVTGIDWFDAWAYAAWKGMRLPTEQEWMQAAGGAGDRWAWGEQPDVNKANVAERGVNRAISISAFADGRSSIGTYQMNGNVWEWTADAADSEEKRILKGGSFRSSILEARNDRHLVQDRLTRRSDIGFRCVIDFSDEQWAEKRAEEEAYALERQALAEPEIDEKPKAAAGQDPADSAAAAPATSDSTSVKTEDGQQRKGQDRKKNRDGKRKKERKKKKDK